MFPIISLKPVDLQQKKKKILPNLKSIPKLDVLSQPFRVSFVEITNYRYAARVERLSINPNSQFSH